MQKLSRRTLVASAAAAAVPATAVPVLNTTEAASGPDTPLFALETRIDQLHDEANRIYVERVDPIEEKFENLMSIWQQSRSKAAQAAMLRFGKESGRDAAIDEADQYEEKALRVINAMWAIPAQTNAGRAAKLRVFFKHVAGDRFSGPVLDLDWDNDLARKLLLEYAGMSEAEAVTLTSAIEGETS